MSEGFLRGFLSGLREVAWYEYCLNELKDYFKEIT